MTEDTSSIGERLRRIRHSRGKSLAVIAGLAGISESHLSRLESGERAMDRRSLIVAGERATGRTVGAGRAARPRTW